MHPCSPRTGTRHARAPSATIPTAAVPAAIATTARHQLDAPLTNAMDRLFMTIGHLDHLIGDMHGGATDRSPAGEWLHELRCARQQLDDVLLGQDRLRELLDHLHGLMDAPAAPRVPLDLNRCLSRVAYVMRALVPDDLRIVRRTDALPTMTGSAPALTQALISLVAHAARGIAGQGVVEIGGHADGGAVALTIDARADGPMTDAPSAAQDAAWSAAVAVLEDHGARVNLQSGSRTGLRIRVVWPAPAGLLN